MTAATTLANEADLVLPAEWLPLALGVVIVGGLAILLVFLFGRRS